MNTETATRTHPLQPLMDAAAKRDSRTLLGAHAILSAKVKPSEEERMTAAAIADTLTERHGLDAELDAIFATDFAGNYHEALLLALAAADVTI